MILAEPAAEARRSMPTLPLIAMFVIALLAFLIVRVGAIALMMTGLPRETANFQALSAFFGVGFTTSEAELVVSHHVRRRVVQHLIVLGNLGITSGLATLIVTVLSDGGEHGLSASQVLGIIIAGIALLFLVFVFKPVRRVLEWIIRQSLKRAGLIKPIDYDLMFRAIHGYAVSEMHVAEDSALAGRTLRQSGLGTRGVLVLGISRRDGEYVGAPAPDDTVGPGDQLLVYGLEENLAAVGASTVRKE